jgi:ATP-dependent DNA helicase PIF1
MTLMDIPHEKRAALDAIHEGRNVFITGAAGTGKSYMLGLIKEQFEGKGLHVTASTGIAAVHIGGVTLHSWAGLGVGTAPVSEIVKFISSAKGTLLRRKLKKAKILAIDEISMISADLLDMLDMVLKTIRDSPRPFGGIQLVLLGDFLQLPPVWARVLWRV